MGRASTKENKTIYQQHRENAGLTRAAASDAMPGISESQIVRMENGDVLPSPDDILLMAKAYDTPELPNYYCTHECSIGKEYVSPLAMEDVSRIVLQVVASINAVSKEKDRLIEIMEDEKVTDDELTDFVKIEKTLHKIQEATGALDLWLKSTLSSDSIDKEKLEAARKAAE